ncbi:MAG: metal ABC transporter permease [Acidimicrobiales bacterium]
MFSGFMINTWEVATIVALMAGVVGFFVVMRGSSFVAHAVPQSAFAGAAGASLLGVSTIFGLGLFALIAALGIGWLGKRGRHDVVTALAVVVMLGLGSLFLSWSTEYAPAIYSLLFGEVLGVSGNEVGLTALLGAVSIATVIVLYRPLLLSSVSPEIAEAGGVRTRRVEMLFLVLVALAATMSVPVVGALLMFTLMVGPPAAARSFVDRPGTAISLSVVIALLTVWASIAASYQTNWPVGFFVGTVSAGAYVAGRWWGWWRRKRIAGPSVTNRAASPSGGRT